MDVSNPSEYFFLPWAVQIVMMTSRNLSLIHDKAGKKVKNTFLVSLPEIQARVPKSSLKVYGARMVQQKRKIQKLFPE